MDKKYFSLVKNEETKEAEINIFGDITGMANYSEDSFLGMFKSQSDYSSYVLSKQLEELGDVETINVHINSYGGEVAEGLAIYNSLKNHKAKVKTYCDGFACSIASVIFMAGDERIMNKSSLLMIHNAWVSDVQGNANELRKQAEDLDVITQASVNAYMEHLNISEEELKTIMDKETWLDYKQCLDMGFATSITNDSKSDKATQSVRDKLIKMILESQEDDEDENNDEDTNTNNVDTNNVDTETDNSPNTDEEDEPNEKITYKCGSCGHVHEGELPEFFVCPNCGADKEQFKNESEDDNNTEDDEVNEKVFNFLNAMIGGMR